MNIIFINSTWKSSTSLLMQHKNRRKGNKHEDQHVSVWEKYAPIAYKSENNG